MWIAGGAVAECPGTASDAERRAYRSRRLQISGLVMVRSFIAKRRSIPVWRTRNTAAIPPSPILSSTR